MTRQHNEVLPHTLSLLTFNTAAVPAGTWLSPSWFQKQRRRECGQSHGQGFDPAVGRQISRRETWAHSSAANLLCERVNHASVTLRISDGGMLVKRHKLQLGDEYVLWLQPGEHS